MLDSRQVHGRALPRDGAFDLLPAGVQPAHAQTLPHRIQLHFFLQFHRAGNQRPGHHRAKSFHRKRAVNRQTKILRRVFRRHLLRCAPQHGLQFIETGTAARAHRHKRRVFQKRSTHEFFDLQAHQSQRVGIHEIGFRNGNNSARNSQQAANFEMLARLQLDTFIRRDYQQHQVNPARTRQHVAHEPLVPRHIHQAQPHALELQKRKTQIQRDTPALFFLQPVWIRASQRFHKRGFAMVNVPRSPDDNVFDSFHGVRANAAMLAGNHQRLNRTPRKPAGSIEQVSVFVTLRLGIAHQASRKRHTNRGKLFSNT